MPWGGGNFNLAFGNTRLATSNLLANYNPAFNSNLTATFTQPLCATSASTTTASRSPSRRSTATSARRSLRATDRADHRQRPQRLLGAGLRPRGGRGRPALARPGPEAGRGQPGARRGRHPGADRRRAGRGRGRQPAPDRGAGRGDAGDGAAGAEAAARHRHQRPAVDAGAARRPTSRSSTQPPLDVEARGAAARSNAHRPGDGAQEPRQQRRHAALLAQPDPAGARPAAELRRGGPGRPRSSNAPAPASRRS